MVNTSYATDGKLGIDLDAIHSTAQQALGTTIVANDATYRYVQCDSTSAITRYDCVAINESNKAYPITKARADDGFRVGFATNAAMTVASYGYVQVAGVNPTVRLAAACAVDVPLYTTGTAGVLDDTSTSQTKIDGLVGTTTSSASGITNIKCIATFPKSTTF